MSTAHSLACSTRRASWPSARPPLPSVRAADCTLAFVTHRVLFIWQVFVDDVASVHRASACAGGGRCRRLLQYAAVRPSTPSLPCIQPTVTIVSFGQFGRYTSSGLTYTYDSVVLISVRPKHPHPPHALAPHHTSCTISCPPPTFRPADHSLPRPRAWRLVRGHRDRTHHATPARRHGRARRPFMPLRRAGAR